MATRVIEPISNGLYECHGKKRGGRSGKDQEKGRRRKGIAGLPFITGIAEIGSFHPESEHDDEQRDIGVQLCNNTVFRPVGKRPGEVGSQDNVVEQPAQDAAEAIDGGFTGELF